MRLATCVSLGLMALLLTPMVSLAKLKPTGPLKKILQDDQGRKIYLDKKTVAKDDTGTLHYWVKIEYPKHVPMVFERKQVSYMLQHRTQHCEKNLMAPSDLEYYFDSHNEEVGVIDLHKTKVGPGKMFNPKVGTTEAEMFGYMCRKFSYLTPQNTAALD